MWQFIQDYSLKYNKFLIYCPRGLCGIKNVNFFISSISSQNTNQIFRNKKDSKIQKNFFAIKYFVSFYWLPQVTPFPSTHYHWKPKYHLFYQYNSFLHSVLSFFSLFFRKTFILEVSEAVFRKYSVQRCQNSRESTCDEFFLLIKIQASGFIHYQRRDTGLYVNATFEAVLFYLLVTFLALFWFFMKNAQRDASIFLCSK